MAVCGTGSELLPLLWTQAGGMLGKKSYDNELQNKIKNRRVLSVDAGYSEDLAPL